MVGMGKLTARQVATLGPGYHADGDGLYLQVTASGARSWILRYQRQGQRREMGLGSASLYGLADARQRAAHHRKVLAEGLDPIVARRAMRAATARTWGEAKADFIAAREPEWKNAAQGEQWRQSLRDYGPNDALPIARLDTDGVLACLRPIWKASDQGGKVETATRVRGRIERIWDAEKVAGNVTGENPARWKGHLEHLLPKPRKVQPQGHHAAMPYADLPAFMARLRQGNAISRKALEFTILTAKRTSEVIGMEWAEVRGKTWHIPAERMKMGVPHDEPLTDAALAVLAGLGKPPFPIGEAAMLALLQEDLAQPYTVHGFRSSFFDWAHETTAFPKHVIDMALAHKIEDKADAAYRRGALLAKRRELMQAWADYLAV